jgi:hypothetical protein
MGTLVKVNGWYDNEWGYSNRMVDITAYCGKAIQKARRGVKKAAATSSKRS